MRAIFWPCLINDARSIKSSAVPVATINVFVIVADHETRLTRDCFYCDIGIRAVNSGNNRKFDLGITCSTVTCDKETVRDSFGLREKIYQTRICSPDFKLYCISLAASRDLDSLKNW